MPIVEWSGNCVMEDKEKSDEKVEWSEFESID